MTFWKIKFDEGLEGFGYIKFDEQMNDIGLFDESGNEVNIPVGYTPIEFDVNPEWA